MRAALAGVVMGAVALTATAPASAWAQSVSGGVSFGVNLNEINVSGNEGLNVLFTDKFEPVFGGFLSFPLSAQAAVECDGLLSIKGSLLEVGGREEKIRLTYLDAPVLVRIGGAIGGGAMLHMLGGGYASYLLDASRSASIGPDADDRSVFRSYDIGWVAGIGFGIAGVRFDFRYSGGVIDIVRDNTPSTILPSPTPQPTAYRNRGFTLLGSYEF